MKRNLVILLCLCPLFLSGCILDTILNDVVNMAPKAVISATPSEGSAPLTVNFDAKFSHDDDGSIAEYHWDFGDPTAAGTATGASNNHTYAHPGTYLAKLTVIDDEGSIGTQQIAVVVSNSVPVAKASVNNENPLPGNKVIFNGTASFDQQGTISSYDWDFGDGTTGSGATIEHTYISGGYYVVTLTVTDEAGATASIHLGMNVMPGESKCGGDDPSCGGAPIRPLPIITMLGITSCSGGTCGVPITFDGTYSQAAVGEIVTYHWDFGDGTTASGGVVTHAYSTPWAYTIKLTVTDSGGGIATATTGCSIGGSSCY